MKKGQSLLVFFGVQLICIILFFIVLLSILTMSQSVSFRVQQFDEETNHILITRWLLSSADCLAYEEKTLIIEESSMNLLTRVYPYVLDVNKVWDYEHVNCIRMDQYDLQSDVMKVITDIPSLWNWIRPSRKVRTIDASVGRGIGLKYDIVVFDLSEEEVKVLTGQDAWFESTTISIDDDIEDYTTTSLLGRVYKQPYQWWISSWQAFGLPCYEERMLDGQLYRTHHTFRERCYDWRIDYTQLIGGVGGRFDEDMPHRAYQPDYVFGFPAIHKNNDLGEDYFHKQYWAAIIAEPIDESRTRLSVWQHEDMNCYDRAVRRTFIPVLLHQDGNFKHGAVMVQTCLLEGSEYRGMSLADFEFMGRLRS